MKVLHSTRVVLAGEVSEAWVVMASGIITAILTEQPSNGTEGNAELVELGDKILMAGVVDPHVHINEPGREEWEGFDSATKAAIAGGVTTLVDMPLNASPVTTTVKAFDEKLAAAKNKLHTNVGFWGGIIPGNENEIEGLIERGVLGFKAFLTHSGIDEFPNATEDDLRKAMPIIAKYNLPLLVHCELITDNGQQPTDNVTSHPPFRDGDASHPPSGDGGTPSFPPSGDGAASHPPSGDGGTSYTNYLNSRPKKWEDDAVALMIRLCEEFNCRTHIVHLSSADSLEQIAFAKQKGLPLTVETGQHYLFFNAEDIKDGQTQFKCAPPIREKANNDQLWKALQDGTIDFVATDHSPATPGLKEIESGDFIKAWGGIASIQFALPVLWTAAKKRNIDFINIAKWLCENPAKLIGRENSKGKIAKGFDADLIVVDEEKTFVADEAGCHHKHKISPYMGQKLFGVVEQTYLAGEKVYDNGQFLQLNKGKIIFHQTPSCGAVECE